jgi:hypothetical protein
MGRCPQWAGVYPMGRGPGDRSDVTVRTWLFARKPRDLTSPRGSAVGSVECDVFPPTALRWAQMLRLGQVRCLQSKKKSKREIPIGDRPQLDCWTPYADNWPISDLSPFPKIFAHRFVPRGTLRRESYLRRQAVPACPSVVIGDTRLTDPILGTGRISRFPCGRPRSDRNI